jgi:predicted AAA+ superfamily ATPase
MELFNNEDLNIDGITSSLTIPDLIFAACRGGWPESLNKKTKKQQLAIVSNYIDIICNSDVSEVDGVKRSPQRVKAILKSYARNISTLATKRTLMKDVRTEYDISPPTYNSYINALEKLYVIQDIPAWSPNIRSANTIRKSHKKEFIDPSIAVASLNLTPEKLLKDFETFGFIFENLCIRDLLVYSSSLNGEVLYYNDDSGLEADCVIYLSDGRYALIEFKLGSREIEKGAENLLKLKKLIKESVENKKIDLEEPSFLAVITGGDMAYTRADGVKVIPIGCLR